MTKQEKRILFFASSAHFFTHFYILVFPALIMPMSRALSVPLSDILGYSFWMYLLFGCMAIPWGWVSDKFSSKGAMSAGILLAGCGMVCAGIATGRTTLILSFALVGIGCAAFHPAGTALVSQGIRERGKALGINGIWGTAGMAAAPFIMGLLNYFFRWQRSLVYIGMFGLVLGISSLAVPFAFQKGEDAKKTEALQNTSALKLFLLFVSIMTAAGLLYQSFTLILPSFIEYKIGGIFSGIADSIARVAPGFSSSESFETLTAGIFTTVVYLFGIAGQYLGGRVSDRYSLKLSLFVFFCAAVPFVPAMYLLNNILVLPASGMFLFFTLGMQPIENSLIAYLTPPRLRSVSYGLKFTVNFGIGSFAVKLSSLMEKHYGIEGVILLVGLFLVLVIAGVTIFLTATRGRVFRH